ELNDARLEREIDGDLAAGGEGRGRGDRAIADADRPHHDFAGRHGGHLIATVLTRRRREPGRPGGYLDLHARDRRGAAALGHPTANGAGSLSRGHAGPEGQRQERPDDGTWFEVLHTLSRLPRTQ